MNNHTETNTTIDMVQLIRQDSKAFKRFWLEKPAEDRYQLLLQTSRYVHASTPDASNTLDWSDIESDDTLPEEIGPEPHPILDALLNKEKLACWTLFHMPLMDANTALLALEKEAVQQVGYRRLPRIIKAMTSLFKHPDIPPAEKESLKQTIEFCLQKGIIDQQSFSTESLTDSLVPYLPPAHFHLVLRAHLSPPLATSSHQALNTLWQQAPHPVDLTGLHIDSQTLYSLLSPDMAPDLLQTILSHADLSEVHAHEKKVYMGLSLSAKEFERMHIIDDEPVTLMSLAQNPAYQTIILQTLHQQNQHAAAKIIVSSCCRTYAEHDDWSSAASFLLKYPALISPSALIDIQEIEPDMPLIDKLSNFCDLYAACSQYILPNQRNVFIHAVIQPFQQEGGDTYTCIRYMIINQDKKTLSTLMDAIPKTTPPHPDHTQLIQAFVHEAAIAYGVETGNMTMIIDGLSREGWLDEPNISTALGAYLRAHHEPEQLKVKSHKLSDNPAAQRWLDAQIHTDEIPSDSSDMNLSSTQDRDLSSPSSSGSL